MVIKGEEDDCSEEFDGICGPRDRACDGRGAGSQRSGAIGGHGGAAGRQGRFGGQQ